MLEVLGFFLSFSFPLNVHSLHQLSLPEALESVSPVVWREPGPATVSLFLEVKWRDEEEEQEIT